MAERLGTGAGDLDLDFEIGRAQYRTLKFREEDATTELDVSTWTFQFLVRKNKGARRNLISLTLGNGISFIAYSDSDLLIFVTGAQTTAIEEGEYYWELVRTDLNIPIMSGRAFFEYHA